MNKHSIGKEKNANNYKCILRVMRITVFLFFFSIMFSHAATSHSQEAKLSLHLKSTTIKEACKEIEKQTGLVFVFADNTEEAMVKKVDIQANSRSISNVLDNILSNTGLNYKILDKQVVIFKEEKKIEALEIRESILEEITQQLKVTITGKITDKNGESLIGANIVEKGTTNGTITDMDGLFSLQVAEGAALHISYIGFLPQEVNTAGRTSFDIILQEDAQSLEDLVVIGYGTTRRKDFTGSVTSVKVENSPIALTSNMNALESLKGNVSGLDIGYTNTAGGAPSMLIRGQHSISGSNDPLIVVDGVIFMGSISDINPNDIASFDILKDATSAAAYGSRSANGVIIISTKKGRSGKPMINLNISGGMQSRHLKQDLMKGEQWLEMVKAKNRYTDNSFLTTQQELNYNAGKEVVWFDEVTRTGWVQDHQVSISGAGEKMNYYLSTSYSQNEGIVVGDDYTRGTVFGKIETNITDWLKVGIDAAYTLSDYSGVAADFRSVALLTPYDMMYHNEAQGLLEKYPNDQSEMTNPLWGVDDQDRLKDLDKRNNFRINMSAEVKIPWVKGLSFQFNYAGNMDYRKTGQFYHESYYAPIGPYDDESRYSASTQRNYLAIANGYTSNFKTTSWVMDNILRYNNTFGKHALDLTAVATRDSRNYDYENFSGTDFSDNGNTILGLGGLHYSKVQKITLDNNKRKNIGYFGRASYSYDDTYYLTASFRRDGASVFGANNKWGNFGAFGGAWRITNEPFMQSSGFLNDLKLKLSWGKNGNQGLNPYGTLSPVSTGSSGGIYYTFGNSGESYYGIVQNALGNADLGWETTEAWNTGFESTWLNNRLFIDLDVYFSRTYDQIFTRSIPVMTGFTNMRASMGEVQNNGVELTVRTVNLNKNDWNWTSGLTFWLNRNKLIHLYGEDLDGDGKEDDDLGNSLFIGHSIHSIFGYKQDGIVQESDVAYMNTNGVSAGTPKYVDVDGDGVITTEDRTIVGKRDPNFKLNLANTVSYKNWELYVMMTGTFGGKGYFQQSNTPAFIAGGHSDFSGSNNMYVPYWTEENRSNKYPAAWFLGDNYFLGLQSRAYVRIQDVTLSYTFRESWVKNIGINHLKLFFSGKNLATITGWEGGDPEIGNTILSWSYPVATTLLLGVNVSF